MRGAQPLVAAWGQKRGGFEGVGGKFPKARKPQEPQVLDLRLFT